MKCCKCKKDVDTSPQANQYPPPKWFGSYKNCQLSHLICAECIKKPENKDWWK